MPRAWIEARAFRRKLMRRPIVLRGDTKFIPPPVLGAIVHPYVQDVLDSKWQDSFKAPADRWDYPLGVLLSFEELCKETIGSCWDAGITPYC